METINAISAAIRSFIVENYMFGRNLPLADSDSLLENGIIDSTGVLELVAHLEETYGIAVADDELIPGNLDSIANITAYLSRKTRGAGSSHEERSSAPEITEMAS